MIFNSSKIFILLVERLFVGGPHSLSVVRRLPPLCVWLLKGGAYL